MSLKPAKHIMQAAIDVAEKNSTPFGAALAMGEELFATAANQTKQKNDPTAHAEIEVIRNLSDQLRKKDLSGFILYTTCEPCPMCTSAIIWSGIQTVVYGCDIPTISSYMKQIEIRAEEMIQKSSANIELHSGFMASECEDLLQKYS
ncbi:MAG: nucleoside deaminase [Balneolaceae bacterium]|nr:nucleoside deaminase [Balneolaceae bacterium]